MKIVPSQLRWGSKKRVFAILRILVAVLVSSQYENTLYSMGIPIIKRFHVRLIYIMGVLYIIMTYLQEVYFPKTKLILILRKNHQRSTSLGHYWGQSTSGLWDFLTQHYGDVIMGAIASQITSLAIVYSTVYSDADQRKHQSSASLAFVWGIHRLPVNSSHKWPVTRKMFDDVIITRRKMYSMSWCHHEHCYVLHWQK